MAIVKSEVVENLYLRLEYKNDVNESKDDSCLASIHTS